jgi:hypothetical protein
MAAIDEVSIKQLEEGYDRLKRALSGELLSKMDLKEAEQKLKDDIVQENQYYKKDNVTPDYGKVKMGELKQAIDVEIGGGKNKLEEKLSTMEGYMKDIRNKKISPAAVDGFVRKTNMVAEATTNMKDTKEKLKVEIDGDIVEALFLLAQAEVDKEKERLDAEDGKAEKPKKDKSELMTLVKALKAKLKK